MRSICMLFAVLIVLAGAQQCEVSTDLRQDCGYLGINQQQCQAKGCCWRPTRLLTQVEQTTNGAPWCFYPSADSTCSNINYSWTGGMGFDSSFYSKMNSFFEGNMNIEGKGGVVAAPDHNTPGGSYYYHWMRDGALTMRTFMEVNNFDLTKIDQKMRSYANWVKNVQGQTDPYGYDIRINPKFNLPSGGVFVGDWCRPQTDGPGLRSASLQLYADTLIKAGNQSYVTSFLIPLIKFDLDWVMSNWQSEGCDLWEEVRLNDHFWGRAAFYYSLGLCETLFSKLGDSSYSSKCSSAKSAVRATLDSHWTGSWMTESTARPKDGAVVHAFSSFGAYSITDQKVAKTMKVLAQTFCSQYSINQQQIKAGVPGILIGRYPGDSYDGGNPWALLTAVFAKTFYQGATVLMESNGFLKQEDKQAWLDLLSLPGSSTLREQVQAALNAGDSVMYRLYQHVKNDGGHINEQIDRNTGIQRAAHDLTWSYANILSAMKEREKAVNSFQELQTFELK